MSEADYRADVQHQIDALSKLVGENRDMISELQADGMVSAEHAEHLERALLSSRTIGAAIGLLMANLDLDEPTAFALLRRVSQQSNRKLRDLADELVRTRDLAAFLNQA